MKIGNLACGAVRPQGEEWWNVDSLYDTLLPGTPERAQLDSEPRYIDRDLTSLSPFEDDSMDGLIFSHALEHFDCQTGVGIMRDCLRCLKPGGILLVSVPDAKYFKSVYDKDTVENAVDLFGEEIHLPDGETTFTGYALWNRWHKALLTEDVLWHYFRRAGFNQVHKVTVAALDEKVPFCFPPLDGKPQLRTMAQHLNRLPFSLVMAGVKE